MTAQTQQTSPKKGIQFNIRMQPELHKRVEKFAIERRISRRALTEDALSSFLTRYNEGK